MNGISSLILMLAIAVPALLSCVPASSPSVPEPSPQSAPTGGGSSANVPPGAEKPVRLAIEDLSRRTGVGEQLIQVQKVEEVEWRDTSLGCPAPDKMYAQVIVPGYLILLHAQGKTYEYHSDQDGRVVLCETR